MKLRQAKRITYSEIANYPVNDLAHRIINKWGKDSKIRCFTVTFASSVYKVWILMEKNRFACTCVLGCLVR